MRKYFHLLKKCIPSASPEAAALFRIVFGTGVVALMTLSPVDAGAVPAGIVSVDLPLLQRIIVSPFLTRPALLDWLTLWLLVSGVFVVVGLWTRGTYVAFVYGALVWGAVHSLRYGHHPISVLLITLVMLILARWGDRWSFDEWLRRRWIGTSIAHRSSEYGYTIWAPSAVLGVAFAAAAWSKMQDGLGWILNGTVKYHFLTDADNAPVEWGLYIGQSYPQVAILLSGGAVAIEAFILLAVISGIPRLRLAAVAGALSLLLGFFLFQGLFWPGWWILLLSFVPWNALTRRTITRQEPTLVRPYKIMSLGSAQWIAVAVLFFQQVGASALWVESPPLVSAYDMYSVTYDSHEAYERAATEYWLVTTLEGSETKRCRLNDADAQMFVGLSSSEYSRPDVQAIITQCVSPSVTPRTVHVDVTRTVVDWNDWRITGRVQDLVAGPVSLPLSP